MEEKFSVNECGENSKKMSVKNSGVFIGIIAVLCCLIIFGAIFFITKQSGSHAGPELLEAGFVEKPTIQGSDYVEDVVGLNMKMVYVEGGTFQMGATSEQGSDADDGEKPVRNVRLDSYYIGACEVTQAQWEKVMGTSIQQQADKADRSGEYYGKGPDYPMYYVSWKDVHAFCQELSRLTGRTYVLPTEAQWEYAARGGNRKDATKYSGSVSVDAVAWYDGNSGNSTHPVGSKRANALGIFDMSGNVREWCYDWLGPYPGSDSEDPILQFVEIYRVYRGGGWNSSARHCRVSARGGFIPECSHINLGFRVVCLP